MRWLRGGRQILGRGLIDPGDRDPLRGCAHELNGFLQVSDCFINFIVDNCEIEVVCVCSLQDIGLLLQALERLILQSEGMEGGVGGGGREEQRRQKSAGFTLFPHFGSFQGQTRSRPDLDVLHLATEARSAS